VFNKCDLEESHLDTLLFDVSRLYPKLKRVDFQNNKIESLQTTAILLLWNSLDEQDDDTLTVIFPRCLQTLILDFNPFTWKLDTLEEREIALFSNPIPWDLCTHEREVYALKMLVDFIPSLTYLGGALYPDEIEYYLGLNIAGRALLNNQYVQDKNGNISELPKPPLSLWPNVLERSTIPVDEICWTRHDGIYYLLRNGPMLCGRGNMDRLDSASESTTVASAKRKRAGSMSEPDGPRDNNSFSRSDNNSSRA
jgi:hypothetical protein